MSDLNKHIDEMTKELLEWADEEIAKAVFSGEHDDGEVGELRAIVKKHLRRAGLLGNSDPGGCVGCGIKALPHPRDSTCPLKAR